MLLQRRIELHLKRTGMTPTRFGREAINDPRFVHDLRRGRQLREETAFKVHAWLDRQGAAR
jgi:2,4-dienoyl-CoA reductase-like NADH-dependent reductase (Old Yellow Enzyme family)